MTEKKTIEAGATFSHERECDVYRPIYYAGASGDFNPIHIDKAVGEQAGLGGVILQGLCTLAWVTEAAVNFSGDPGAITRVRARFSKPVKPADVVTFEGKVVSVEGGIAKTELSAK